MLSTGQRRYDVATSAGCMQYGMCIIFTTTTPTTAAQKI